MSLLEVREIRKLFPVSSGLLSTLLRKEHEFVHAVDGVDLKIDSGEIVGLVGESGCGKTTLGMVLAMLEPATSGTVFFEGTDMLHYRPADYRHLRRSVQIIFQNPFESLNARWKVFDLVAEPLVSLEKRLSKQEMVTSVTKILGLVGLHPVSDFIGRYPHELSGGQLQRVSIARSLILDPRFVVADEPVSMLDVSIRVGILNLILRLREQLGLAFLLITHDLSVARYVCDRIAVMYLGKIVEAGPAESLIERPRHPYTQLLLAAVPVAGSLVRRARVFLEGGPSDPVHPPRGCRFHLRCPYARDLCREKEPESQDHENGHFVACHYPEELDLQCTSNTGAMKGVKR